MFGQEHKLSQEELNGVRSSLHGQGYDLFGCAAECTRVGAEADARCRSGGTCIIVPQERGAEELWLFGQADLTTPLTRGRLSGCYTRDLGGVACLAVYFGVGGWTEVNQALAAQILQVVAVLRVPWVLAGDFNMEAEMLLAGMPWLWACATVFRTTGGPARWRSGGLTSTWR